MKNNIKVVLDTNILLVSISSKSKYHWIYKGLLNSAFDLCISHEILLEYEKIISAKFNSIVAQNTIRTLLLLPNVHQTNVFFYWNLITDDKDDNKFADCYLSANANILVTNDKHFDILKNINFPKINIIDINKFGKILNNNAL